MNHQEIQKLIDNPAAMREILRIAELDAMINEIFPSVPLEMEYKIIKAGTWKEPRFSAENSADMTAYTGIFERALRECRLGAFGSSVGWTPENGYRVWFHPPAEELPFIDIPAWSAPDDIPLTLSLEMPPSRLSDKTIEQLKLLHAQDYLAVDVIKKHVSIPAEFQINAAKEITDNIPKYSQLLTWRHYPNASQLQTICALIFDVLMAGQRKDDVASAAQLNYKIRNLQNSMPRGIGEMIKKELQNTDYCKDPSDAVEKTLNFLRRWGEFNFPKYLSAIDDIQKYVLQKSNIPSGDYHLFSEQVKHWFLPPSATFLEEYGIPFQVALKIEQHTPLGDTPDEIVSTLKKLNIATLPILPIEQAILDDAISHL